MKKRIAFKFRLYVAGGAHNSIQAITNLRAMCNTHLAGEYHIEIVDVFKDPKRALADGVFMTPTLVRLAPAPMLRVVGTLSQTATLLQTLSLDDVAA